MEITRIEPKQVQKDIFNKIFRFVTPFSIIFIGLIIFAIWLIIAGNSINALGALAGGIFLFVIFTAFFITYIALRKTILRKTSASKLWVFEIIFAVIVYFILYK